MENGKLKVRYIGPGTPDGRWVTDNLTLGKVYDANYHFEDDEALVNLIDDKGNFAVRAIKGIGQCPFDEYFEIVEE